MKIQSKEDKKVHPIASKIPNQLWESEFKWSFDEEIFQVTENGVLSNPSKVTSLQKRILFIIYNPNTSVFSSEYEKFSSEKATSNLEILKILDICISMGHLASLKSINDMSHDTLVSIVERVGALLADNAAKNNQFDTLKWLAKQFPNQVNLQDAINTILIKAADTNNLDDLNWLKQNLPNELACNIKNCGYYELLSPKKPKQSGRLTVLGWLKENFPVEHAQHINNNGNYNFEKATENGHLQVLKWFSKEAPNFIAKLIAHNNYYIFHSAAYWGHLAILQWLKTEINPAEFAKLVKEKINSLFKNICRYGYFDILNWFKEECPDELDAIIKQKGLLMPQDEYSGYHGEINFDMYKWFQENYPDEMANPEIIRRLIVHACMEGHLDTLIWIKKIYPNQFSIMTKSAFFFAACHGHLHILNWFKEQLTTAELTFMITEHNNEGFRAARDSRKPEVVNWMLLNPQCFAYAECHTNKYTKESVNLFIKDTLNELHLEYESNPNQPFDIQDPQKAELCFYLIRNYIRKNDRNLNKEIQFLLDIPRVRALVDQDKNKELLSLAVSLCNREAAIMLLNRDDLRPLSNPDKFETSILVVLRNASRTSNLEEFNWLNQNFPNELIEIAILEFLKETFKFGNTDDLTLLKQHFHQNLIEATIRGVLKNSFKNVNKDDLTWLKQNFPNELTKIITAEFDLYYNKASKKACKTAHFDILNWLYEEYPDELATKIYNSKLEILSLNRYGENLRISFNLFKWFHEHYPLKLDASKDLIQYFIYEVAANGLLDELIWFKEHYPQILKERMNHTFRDAADKRELNILKWIKDQVDLNEFISFTSDKYTKRELFRHSEITKWLLLDPQYFAYEESHVDKYNIEPVKHFIQQTLAELHEEHKSSLNMSNKEPFDLQDPKRAELCFYIIRNYIRQNKIYFDEEIKFLLAIPKVRALAHQEANELIRLAGQRGNKEAAIMLLKIEAVKTLAEQYDFYQQEARGDFDLKQLASEVTVTAVSRVGMFSKVDGQHQLNHATEQSNRTAQPNRDR